MNIILSLPGIFSAQACNIIFYLNKQTDISENAVYRCKKFLSPHTWFSQIRNMINTSCCVHNVPGDERLHQYFLQVLVPEINELGTARFSADKSSSDSAVHFT